MKNIWIINHYATPPSLGGLNRHHYFAKYLQKKGYDVKIFASSAIHNSKINMYKKNKNKLFCENKIDDVHYIHIRSSQYEGKIKRVVNMLQFYFRTNKVAKSMKYPDVIYTSSPQPLSAVLSLKLAKKFNIPCIVEIRDLWPKSIVSFGLLKENNPIVKILYKIEKYIYLHADKIIFTMEGGIKYLKSRNYSKEIDFNKVFHINNGIDLQKYRLDFKNNKIKDKDLLNKDTFKVVYTGSIRFIYNVGKILEVAQNLKKYKDIVFLIYGDGPYREELVDYCKKNELSNVKIKGFVDVKFIPYILKKSDLCLLHGNDSEVFKYGMSTNKSFMYFASGKPILSTYNNKYDLVSKYNCGITLKSSSITAYSKAILKFKKMSEEKYKEYSANSLKLSKNYDYKKLTDKLIDIIEE